VVDSHPPEDFVLGNNPGWIGLTALHLVEKFFGISPSLFLGHLGLEAVTH
jgi:uncharacterized membrane protein YuzA (DUF378 family)